MNHPEFLRHDQIAEQSLIAVVYTSQNSKHENLTEIFFVNEKTSGITPGIVVLVGGLINEIIEAASTKNKRFPFHLGNSRKFQISDGTAKAYQKNVLGYSAVTEDEKLEIYERLRLTHGLSRLACAVKNSKICTAEETTSNAPCCGVVEAG